MTITPAHCRAARALLDWTQEDLERASKVAKKTIADFERGARNPFPRTLADIVKAFEAAGIEFTNGDEPGVRLRKVAATNGERPAKPPGTRASRAKRGSASEAVPAGNFA